MASALSGSLGNTAGMSICESIDHTGNQPALCCNICLSAQTFVVDFHQGTWLDKDEQL
jgi:hypothetical protein